MNTPASLHRRSSAAGFTLIEVLVSMLIFAVGVLGTVSLQARAAQFAEQNSDRSRAAVFANELVSNLWANQTATPDNTWVTKNWAPRLMNPAVSGLPSASYTLSTTGNSTTVTIYWKGPSVAAAAAAAKYTTTVVIQ